MALDFESHGRKIADFGRNAVSVQQHQRAFVELIPQFDHSTSSMARAVLVGSTLDYQYTAFLDFATGPTAGVTCIVHFRSTHASLTRLSLPRTLMTSGWTTASLMIEPPKPASYFSIFLRMFSSCSVKVLRSLASRVQSKKSYWDGSLASVSATPSLTCEQPDVTKHKPTTTAIGNFNVGFRGCFASVAAKSGATRAGQWLQTSSISTRKPFGMRGGVSPSYLLHHGHGAPAAPHPQALGPSHGLPGWTSHTQPISWQSVHFIVDYCCLPLMQARMKPFGLPDILALPPLKPRC
jgi:hypothetical protein